MVNCGLFPMKTCFLSLFLCASSAWAQAPAKPADQKKYYDDNIDKYREVKIKMIMTPFLAAMESGGKKALTEAEAKAKADSVVRLARSGVDFVKLVKEHSEDPGTMGRDGDLGI